MNFFISDALAQTESGGGFLGMGPFGTTFICICVLFFIFRHIRQKQKKAKQHEDMSKSSKHDVGNSIQRLVVHEEEFEDGTKTTYLAGNQYIPGAKSKWGRRLLGWSDGQMRFFIIAVPLIMLLAAVGGWLAS